MSGFDTSRAADPVAFELSDPEQARQQGVLLAVGAYTWWGLVPAYFKLVETVAPFEVLSHRVIWSAVLVVALLAVVGAGTRLLQLFRQPRTLLLLLVSAALIGLNWLGFIFAVFSHQTLQSSLAYFIVPIVNVLIGALALGERLERLQWWSVALAAGGVATFSVGMGVAPWLALGLVITFSLYGLIRKFARVDALTGLAFETLLLLPLALAYVGSAGAQGQLAFGGHSTALSAALVLIGPVSFVPMLLFTAAMRRLPLSTIGFLQYISPTGQFLLAVLAFGERFTIWHALCFGLIWCGLLLFSADLVRARRSPARAEGDARQASRRLTPTWRPDPVSDAQTAALPPALAADCDGGSPTGR